MMENDLYCVRYAILSRSIYGTDVSLLPVIPDACKTTHKDTQNGRI